jgi:hypothetical protein
VFVQPKFTGRRFDDHTMPVDVASDLKAYQTLLVGLAKHLFFLDNPNRQRVPQGFADVHLAIQGMGEGSTLPALILATVTSVSTATMMPDWFDASGYLVQARDLIAECIAAPETSLPARFPKKLLKHFNQIGRSLREDETLELQTGNQGQTAVLNHEKRKKLVLATNAVYERESELEGYIEEVDFEKDTFRLRLDDSRTTIVPMAEDHHDRIRQSVGRVRDRALVRGVAVYDSYERLQKVVAVESLDIIKNYYMAKRFDALGQLEDGWCRGSGVALDKVKLDAVARKLTDFYPEHLRLPTITPTLDGNLLVEWGSIGRAGDTPCYGGGPSVSIRLSDMAIDFCVLGTNGEGIEKCFGLEKDGDIESFIDFLSGHVPQGTEGVPDAPSLYSIASERLADLDAGRSTVFSIEEVMREYGLAD